MALPLLFGGVPGGPELLIILLVVVLLLGIPAVLVLGLGGALGYSLSRNRDRDDRDDRDERGGVDEAADRDRVDRLERQLAETRAELEELRAERPGRDEVEGSNGADDDRR